MIPGKHIYLRPVTMRDAKTILEWENDPALWEVTSTPGPFTLQEIKEFISKSTNVFEQHQMRWIICEKSNDQPVGALDIFEFNPKEMTAGVGILIAEKSNRNKGYGKEALRTFITFARDTLRFSKLHCMIHVDNHPSLRIFEQCGFTIHGIRYFRNKKACKLDLEL